MAYGVDALAYFASALISAPNDDGTIRREHRRWLRRSNLLTAELVICQLRGSQPVTAKPTMGLDPHSEVGRKESVLCHFKQCRSGFTPFC